MYLNETYALYFVNMIQFEDTLLMMQHLKTKIF